MAGRISRQSVAALCAVLAMAAPAAGPALTPAQQAVVQHISEDSLRGHLSFIASDALEGRATPSRGLDLAAEYIAAQFRRAGLEPAGNAGYFQTAKLAHGTARNVAGILRGSDPALRNTYVILSAHYDHIGTRPDGPDRIYNGANDDGSGTVSVIEIAAALAASPERPQRSILFLTFYGEERRLDDEGLLGSRYYTGHPLVPLKQTIADVNLEQVGRTDASSGPQTGVAYVSGFDYSDLGGILADAAGLTGVRIAKDDPRKGEFFDLSDNITLARAGIPSHTLYVADMFPDYHGVGDEWQKIDYANMAKLDRAVALGLLRLASASPPPKWNEALPETRRFARSR